VGVEVGVGVMGTGVLVKVGIDVGVVPSSGRLVGTCVRVVVAAGPVVVGSGREALHPVVITHRELRNSNQFQKNSLRMVRPYVEYPIPL